ncbi:hypothetical protein ACFYP6_29785 [Streptomyces goshikiensis]|uniref:hypothetical protein n=1 Tax=Streptomyces goshikiensis TaxID=1942 RepID=UPI0036869017
MFDTSGADVLPDSVDLAGSPDRVITIADMNVVQHGVRFTGMDPADRAPEALPTGYSGLRQAALHVLDGFRPGRLLHSHRAAERAAATVSATGERVL